MDIVITFVIWAALIQGLFLGVLFIVTNKYRSSANKWLGLFLLAFVINGLSDFLPLEEIGEYSLSGYFTLPEVKLFSPIFFAHYIFEKLGRAKVYRYFLIGFYLLAVAILSLFILNILLFIIQGKSLMDIIQWSLLDHIFLTQQYIAFLLTVIVFVLAIVETRHYHTIVKNEISDMSLLNISWLWQFILILSPIILVWGIELMRIASGGTGQSMLTTIVYLFIAVLIYFVSYKAFIQQSLFDNHGDSPSPSKHIDIKSYKSTSTLDDFVCFSISANMEEKEFFLNQNLTLHQLSREIEISPRTISQCINQSLGSNFNEWVNGYRVDRAVDLLSDPDMEYLSIEGIGLESGFKSRSAMYAAFQKKLGKSPGHFR